MFPRGKSCKSWFEKEWSLIEEKALWAKGGMKESQQHVKRKKQNKKEQKHLTNGLDKKANVVLRGSKSEGADINSNKNDSNQEG